MRFVHIVGARPNFMKVSPVMAALAGRAGVTQELIHTGQHYDARMSDVFFRELDLPEPNVNLEVGSGTHAEQTAQIMIRLEKVLLNQSPDWVVVYGDVNSTLAAALVCAKLHIRVAHVEAGLRSFDRTMPEEINRIVTDRLSDALFAPSQDGIDNLRLEGVPADHVHLVGNVMIDTLSRLKPRAEARWQTADLQRWSDRPYVLVTLHRPANVDEPAALERIMRTLTRISERVTVLFPVHPRTRQRLSSLGFDRPGASDLQLVDPLGYLDFVALEQRALAVVTDSGGVQEETTWLGVPCLTLRPNTERPITITLGTNRLIGGDVERLAAEVSEILAGREITGCIPPLWDGQAGRRIADILTSGPVGSA